MNTDDLSTLTEDHKFRLGQIILKEFIYEDDYGVQENRTLLQLSPMGVVARISKLIKQTRADKTSTLLSDSEVLSWLEKNLHMIIHDRQTCSVDMSGDCLSMTLDNEARGSGGGPGRLRIRGRTIRDCIEKAMLWQQGDGTTL